MTGKRVGLRATPASRPARKIAPATTTQARFAICVRNDHYPASLELRKLYRVLDDDFAVQHDMVRIVDESGEDYLYPGAYFVRVELPAAVEATLSRIA